MGEHKELLIKAPEDCLHYKVYYENGGQLPNCLTGLYTSQKEAQKAIDSYLNKKNRKNATISGK